MYLISCNHSVRVSRCQKTACKNDVSYLISINFIYYRKKKSILLHICTITYLLYFYITCSLVFNVCLSKSVIKSGVETYIHH